MRLKHERDAFAVSNDTCFYLFIIRSSAQRYTEDKEKHKLIAIYQCQKAILMASTTMIFFSVTVS